MQKFNSKSPEYHNWLIEQAYKQAQIAQTLDEVPIGAVIANQAGEIIAASHNRRHLDNDPTAHAEVLAIKRASEILGDWRLTGCTLAVTLEPCPMCSGAIVLSRISTVVYGARDPKAGAARSVFNLCDNEKLNHRAEIIEGIEAEKCGQILTDFFRAQRAKGKK